MNWLTPHLPVMVGLIVGTLARYGVSLDDHLPVTRSQIASQLLMLGLLGLIAETGNDLAGLGANGRALAGAGAAYLGARLVRRFERWTEAAADQRFPVSPPPEEHKP